MQARNTDELEGTRKSESPKQQIGEWLYFPDGQKYHRSDPAKKEHIYEKSFHKHTYRKVSSLT